MMHSPTTPTHWLLVTWFRGILLVVVLGGVFVSTVRLAEATTPAATFDGWVPVGVPPGDAVEPAGVIVTTLYNWARQNSTIMSGLAEPTSAIGRVYSSPQVFRRALLERYPFFAAERITRATLRAQLPRRNGQTGLTLPPFVEVGTLPTPSVTTLTLPTPPRPPQPPRSPAVRQVVTPELSQSITALRENQQETTQTVETLRTALSAVEGRLAQVVERQAATEQARAQQRTPESPLANQVQSLTGGHNSLRDRVSTLERFQWWSEWFVVAGVMVALIMIAMLGEGVYLWWRLRALENELITTKQNLVAVRVASTTEASTP